jgi:hypothetical protein
VKRFVLLLRNEFVLFRTAIPVHMIGIFQPALMFSLMALVLVTPTFDMQITTPQTDLEYELVSSMEQVGSPIGSPYINPVLVDSIPGQDFTGGQLIEFLGNDGNPTALQRFGLIDSNMVKNFRNRLTSAALLMWNNSLGNRAVAIRELPWLPRDIPYSVYFGMAMMPLAANLAGALIGAFLTAQEFEFNTVLELRLSPIPVTVIAAARLLRLGLTGLLSGMVLMVVIGFTTGVWPVSIGWVMLILFVMGIIGGSIGTTAGLILKKTLPAFLVGLALSFFTWLLGSAFGLAAGFSGPYEIASRLMPNTYAVELLFPLYYRISIGTSLTALVSLLLACMAMILVTMLTFRHEQLKT